MGRCKWARCRRNRILPARGAGSLPSNPTRDGMIHGTGEDDSGAIILMDDDWSISSSNNEWRKWFSAFSMHTTGKIWDFMHPDDCDRLKSVLKSWRESGTRVSTVVPVRMLIVSGGIYSVNFHFGKLSGQNLYFGTFSVPSKRTDLENRWEYFQRGLTQAENPEALSLLIGGVAHDYRNHLTIILGIADLLLGKGLGPTEMNLVQEILSLCLRSIDLTNQVLAYAKTAKRSFAPVDVHDVIVALASLLGHGLDQRITIVQDLAAKRSVVPGDLGQLENALMNIARNALEAMPDGGTLEFVTSNVFLDRGACLQVKEDIPPGDYLKISVEDTGDGIDPDFYERIFEPFYTTKGPGKGTGLGLALVRTTVRRHFGTIQVSSGVSSGTRFDIYLPLIDSDSKAAGIFITNSSNAR